MDGRTDGLTVQSGHKGVLVVQIMYLLNATEQNNETDCDLQILLIIIIYCKLSCTFPLYNMTIIISLANT
jgi:hypothetical protein